MGRLLSFYTKSLDLLKELNTKYPSFGIGRHIAGALSDYGDSWGISDKEFYFALTKYAANLELYDGVPIAEESELEKIIREGQNLDTILNEDDEEDM